MAISEARQWTGGRPRLYDWDGWFAQRRFRLVKGRHYACPTSSIVQQVRQQASERGYSASVIVSQDDSEITVVVAPRRR